MERDAKLYDEQHGFVGWCGEELVEEVRALAARRPAEAGRPRILDIGCGTGAHLEALGQLGSVVGIDSSPDVVERARAKHPDADVRVADACALPFEGRFDIAFSNAAFHWIADQVTLLKSVSAALVPDGMLVAEMGAHGNIGRIEEGYTQAMRKHSGDYTCQFCFPKESSMRRLLAIAGFEVVSLETFDRPTPLPGGREGLRRWAGQFFARSLALYRPQDREPILDDFEQACEPDLWDAGQGCWIADYRRMRFTARKVRSVAAADGSSPLSVLGA